MTWSRLPLQNINTCIISRPPVVIFSLCLAVFCIVTFSLGVYVKHSTAPIRNPDELNWNDVAEKMRRLDFCLQPIEEFQSPNLTGTDAVSVAFEFNAALSHVWKNVSLVVGSLSNSDLGLEHSSLVNVSFTMSHLESQKQLCLTFYHPPSLIMPKTVPGCDPLKYNLAPKSAGAFVIPRIDRLPSAARFPNCPEKQKFNVGLQENPSWNVMLNQDDRNLISLHLLVTSFFLLVVFITIVCFAAFRGNGVRSKSPKMNISNVSEEDKEPLNP